ncbi:MAG: imidazole glycerol phosphate synthase subunit HisH [Thermoplasmatota archaeon]
MSAPTIRILDYGVGNLHSLAKALERGGARAEVTADPKALLAADGLVLPGVGAFGDAAKKLAPFGAALGEALDRGKPLLGVCLGMQLLFDASDESPGAEGLGLIRGDVKRLVAPKLPQIGWNELAFLPEDPLFSDLKEGTHVYYVNSFAPVPRESVTIATSTYGATFTAAVRKKSAWGTQYHPEKSGRAGLTMVRNFVQSVEAGRNGA